MASRGRTLLVDLWYLGGTAVVDGGQVGGERGGAVGAKDALGVESGEHVEQGVFADVGGAGVGG
jgi:hypothetical protein